MSEKKCSICEEVKPLSEFRINGNRADGDKHYCKECKRKSDKEYRDRPEVKAARQKHKEKTYVSRKPEQARLREKGKKRCSKCQEIWLLDGFPKDANYHDGRASVCKKCKNEKEKERRELPEIKAHYREYVRENRGRWGTKPPSELGKGQRTPGYIYVFQWREFTKIGMAIRPKERIKAIDGFLPTRGKLIKIIQTNDMFGTEQMLHLKFSKSRQGGEWFILSDTDIEYLLGLESL